MIVIGNRMLMQENGIAVAGLQAFEETVGHYEKQGDTIVFMGWDGRLRAVMVISDIVRAEAVEAINETRKMNCAVEVMSGDTSATTQSIASQIGIDAALSEASPIRKKDYVAELQNEGHRVMMVGDGINDAPALTEASVGIAMGRGTDIALESADAVLIRDDLRLIPYFIGLSRKTFSIIRQNIFWAFFYNIVAIPLAVAGILHPIIAAGAMAASSLFVVGNSLRIRG
jgi:Cu2+-exporting ATPase